MALQGIPVKEASLLFGKEKNLVGIITDPLQPHNPMDLPGVILLNTGIFHRVGPNRLYVKIARDLASVGFSVLRYDFSGIGDSQHRKDNLPFLKSAILETQEAMSCLNAERGVERFVLIGICSGATISFRTACHDDRVVGALLINARTHLNDWDNDSSSYISNRTLSRHYWRIALFSSFRAKNWLKAITGKVDVWARAKGMFAGFRTKSKSGSKSKLSSQVSRAEANLHSLTKRGVQLLHLYSEGDEGLDYIHVVLGRKFKELTDSGLLNMEIIEGANHTFTLLWSQERLLTRIRNWMEMTARNVTAK